MIIIEELMFPHVKLCISSHIDKMIKQENHFL